MRRLTTVAGAIAGLATLPSGLAADSHRASVATEPSEQPENRIQPSEMASAIIKERAQVLQRDRGNDLLQLAQDKFKDAGKFILKNAFSNFDNSVRDRYQSVINPAYRQQLYQQRLQRLRQQRQLQLQRINELNPLPGLDHHSVGPVAANSTPDVQTVHDKFKPE